MKTEARPAAPLLRPGPRAWPAHVPQLLPSSPRRRGSTPPPRAKSMWHASPDTWHEPARGIPACAGMTGKSVRTDRTKPARTKAHAESVQAPNHTHLRRPRTTAHAPPHTRDLSRRQRWGLRRVLATHHAPPSATAEGVRGRRERHLSPARHHPHPRRAVHPRELKNTQAQVPGTPPCGLSGTSHGKVAHHGTAMRHGRPARIPRPASSAVAPAMSGVPRGLPGGMCVSKSSCDEHSPHRTDPERSPNFPAKPLKTLAPTLRVALERPQSLVPLPPLQPPTPCPCTRPLRPSHTPHG